MCATSYTLCELSADNIAQLNIITSTRDNFEFTYFVNISAGGYLSICIDILG